MQIKFFERGLGLALLAPLLMAGADGTLRTFHGFDASSEGWSVVDVPNAPTHPPTILATHQPAWLAGGGNPAGYIQMLDPGVQWFWFAAPAELVGNHLEAYGGTLSFQLRNDQPPNTSDAKVALVGAQFTVYHVAPDAAADWRQYHVRLREHHWRLNSPTTFNQPTATQFRAILADLQAVYISGDMTNGADLAGLDNVALCELVPGDLSGDARVDMADINAFFSHCMVGPDLFPPSCTVDEIYAGLLDGIGDADVRDFAVLQPVYGTGCE